MPRGQGVSDGAGGPAPPAARTAGRRNRRISSAAVYAPEAHRSCACPQRRQPRTKLARSQYGRDGYKLLEAVTCPGRRRGCCASCQASPVACRRTIWATARKQEKNTYRHRRAPVRREKVIRRDPGAAGHPRADSARIPYDLDALTEKDISSFPYPLPPFLLTSLTPILYLLCFPGLHHIYF